MKLSDNITLDFIGEDILYYFCCTSYPATLLRLNELQRITADSDMKDHIDDLTQKLLLHTDQERYKQLLYQNRLQMEKGVKSKLHFARELIEMKLKKAG